MDDKTTTVTIEPGICGLPTRVTATYDEEENIVTIDVHSACEAVRGVTKELGNQFDPYEVVLVKPGQDPISQFAGKTFPGHASCPTIAGILKCIEVSAGLALPKDVHIHFE
ncbi:MAG: DUF6951 family protein [Fastidiosipilaceae bacterium]|jgi:hypothetical protein